MLADRTTTTTPDTPRSACDLGADRSTTSDRPDAVAGLLELADADNLSSRRVSDAIPEDGGRSDRGQPFVSSSSVHTGGPGQGHHLSQSEMYRPGASFFSTEPSPHSAAGRRNTNPFPSSSGRHLPAAYSSVATTLLPPPAPMAAKVGRSPPLMGSLDDSEFNLEALSFGIGALGLPLLPPPMNPVPHTRPIASSSDDDDH